ncbi:MAG: RNA polymerase sigma factor [Clostridia bacterium]|nr:RNA polymerase sigma factor [Clostridia bacterium]
MEKENVLIRNILNGDIGSFETLIAMYRNRIFNFLLKMTLSKEDSEDLTQEVFIRVYNNLYQYNNKWCFSTWIYKIAVNVFKTEYIKRKNRNLAKVEEMLNESQAYLYRDPEALLENRENKMEIIKMLDSLRVDQKAALILKYVQGFSYKEIGEILKMSPDNVKMRVLRAKKELVKTFTRRENA